ncbi:galectin-9-like [Vipera latastei]
MRLLLTFALTFMLSAQQENANEMMEKVTNAIGEEGLTKVMNALDDYDLEKLMECIEKHCEMADFVDLMEKMLNALKEIPHGEKLIYKLIKGLVKHGPLAELVNELSEEDALEIINALDAREIEKIMNIGKHQVGNFVLMPYREKIMPIIMKANDGKGLPKLMSMLTGDTNAKPTLPYHQPVPGGLHPGMSVYMQGTVPKHANRFLLDFACCQHNGSDIPFHFSPQFDAEDIVLNTFQAGRWGKEEKYKMPFQNGEHFEVIFLLSGAGYQIIVNKKLFCTFKHRMPLQSVQNIHVDGDLELQTLAVMEGPMMGNVNLPYHQPVPDGLHPGMAIYVQGTLPKYTKGFSELFRVNFACEGADIPLHFIPTFVWNHIGLNTFQDGKWGREDKRNMVLQKGEHFEVIFIVTEARYQVLVNRKPFCTYKHRIPPQSVRDINVDGHLELQSLTVIGGPMTGNMSMLPNNGYGTPKNLPMLMGPVIYYPPMPYMGYIPRDLGASRTISLQGFIPKNTKRFEIKLMAGQDIALRINPRMKERTVVRNSFLNGRWGPEENYLPFNPFQCGQYFELSIHYDKHEFQVYTNGHPFFNYAHRYIPIEHIRTLKITGDVTLSYIKY